MTALQIKKGDCNIATRVNVLNLTQKGEKPTPLGVGWIAHTNINKRF